MTDMNNDISLKPKTLASAIAPAATAKGSTGTFAGLAATFQDLLHRTGARLETGFEALAGHDFAHNTGRDDITPTDDDHKLRPDDNKDQRANQSSRSDNGNDNRPETRATERGDDHGRNDGQDHREERADNGAANHDNGHSGDKGDTAKSSDDGGRDGDNATAKSKDSGDGAGTDSKNADNSGDGSQTAGKGENAGDGKTVSAGTDAAAVQRGIRTQAMGLQITALAGGNAHASDGKASDRGKVSAADGLATANNKILRAQTDGAGNSGNAATDSRGQSLHGQANTNTHAGLKAETEVQTANTTTQNQAAGIAKAIGDGTRTQVNVSVTNEAQTLTSRPTQTLNTGPALPGDGDGKAITGTQNSGNSQTSARGQQGQTSHSQAQGQQAQAGLSQAQTQSQQTQSTNSQGQQGQALSQVAAGAKGGVGSTVAAGASGGTAHAGGGESAPTTGTGQANAAQQASEAAKAAQAKQAHRPAAGNRSLAEQISVRINKSVQAGNNRINIQLRPTSLGRVEVKMDLSHDGRIVATVTADRPETLDQLQKESRDLQRALADAGLSAQSGDLTFNLRGEEGHGKNDSPSTRVAPVDDELAGLDDVVADDAVAGTRDGIYVNGRIDVRA